MQVRDARAEFYITDSESCRADRSPPKELEVEVDGMWLRAFGVRVLHVCSGAYEEGRGGVAAIGDCAYTPGVFEDEGVGVGRERSDGQYVREGDGRHEDELCSKMNEKSGS